MVAATVAACAWGGAAWGWDGSSAVAPGERTPLAGSRPLLDISGATQESRWSLAATAQREPWEADGRAPVARLSARDAADGSASRASFAFDYQQRLGAGRLSATAFAARRHVGLFSGEGFESERMGQRDARATGGAIVRMLAGGFSGAASLRVETLDASAHWMARPGEMSALREDRLRQSVAALEARQVLPLPGPFTASIGGRLDAYRFSVGSDLPGRAGGAAGRVVAPHVSIEMAASPATRLFARLGGDDERGARVAVDPRTRSPLGALDPASDALGITAGIRQRWGHALELQLDASRVRTRREIRLDGTLAASFVERPALRDVTHAGLRWSPAPELTFDVDYARLDARYDDGAREAVPGSASQTATAGATVRPLRGWSASLFVSRFSGPAGADDEAQRIRSSTLVNGRLNYNLSKKTRLTLDVFNIFDQATGPIDYYAASRLWGRPGMADDFLFHPAEPRGFRLRLRKTF